MKIKKLMLFALPVMALSVGIVALNTPKTSEEYSTVEAANYTPSNRKFTFNNDGSVSATFSVNDNTLDTKGWLLCLFENEPSFDPVTHKINGSDNKHPYTTADCKHYFFAKDTTKEGNVSVSWDANFADQKTNWSEEKSTSDTNNLATYINSSTDWYLVIGIRHYHGGSDWGTDGDEPGEGTNGCWENADYYVGRKSIIEGNLPYGEIYFDLTELSDWIKDGAQLAVKFKNGTNEAYSDFAVSVPSQSNIYIASYELDFVPTNMIGCRFSSDSETPSSSGTIWNKTQELSFYRYGVIGVTQWGETGKDSKGWSDGLATVKIDGVTDEIILDNYKRNAAGQSEHYNDYIDLKKGDKFTIHYHNNYYHNMDCLEAIDGYFEVKEGSDKITANVNGTYSFYFKANESASYQVFISVPAIAFADGWAQSFLEGTGEDTSCEKTKTNWSSHEDEYDNLPHSAKTFLLNVAHESDPNVKFDNYFARAIQRYDYIIYLYGTSTYNDYIGRVDAGKVTPRSTYNPIIGAFSSDNSTPIALVVIISVVSLTAVGGYIFLKRRKEN